MKTKLTKRTKFIFITGGVLSSLGKGLAAASLGALLESRGMKVTFQKLDPYINVDPGTMNPFQHGEVYVTDDGAETDLDMGHYERYTDAVMAQINNYTSGRIYYSVIQKERRGEYLGGTVQVIPHITDEIKNAVLQLDGSADIAIIEIGGTIGDIEGLPFVEAIRQLRSDLGREHTLFIHLTLVPYIRAAGEVKTKPTQHSVKELLASGIQPDILVCRTEQPLNKELKKKIALFCNVEPDSVITAIDVESIYEVPLHLHEEGLDDRVLEKLGIWTGAPYIKPWEELVDRIKNPQHQVVIGITGKYVDSEGILQEPARGPGARRHCQQCPGRTQVHQRRGSGERRRRRNCWPAATASWCRAASAAAASRARSAPLPMPGKTRCRSSASASACSWPLSSLPETSPIWTGRNSTELDPATPYPVIYLMKEWFDFRTKKKEIRDENSNMGGTLRLGAYPCVLKEGTLAHKAYRKEEISERHRHRYEFNNRFRDQLAAGGSGHQRHLAGRRPWWRSSSSPTTRGFSAASFIPSSSRSP